MRILLNEVTGAIKPQQKPIKETEKNQKIHNIQNIKHKHANNYKMEMQRSQNYLRPVPYFWASIEVRFGMKIRYI